MTRRVGLAGAAGVLDGVEADGVAAVRWASPPRSPRWPKVQVLSRMGSGIMLGVGGKASTGPLRIPIKRPLSRPTFGRCPERVAVRAFDQEVPRQLSLLPKALTPCPSPVVRGCNVQKSRRYSRDTRRWLYRTSGRGRAARRPGASGAGGRMAAANGPVRHLRSTWQQPADELHRPARASTSPWRRPSGEGQDAPPDQSAGLGRPRGGPGDESNHTSKSSGPEALYQFAPLLGHGTQVPKGTGLPGRRRRPGSSGRRPPAAPRTAAPSAASTAACRR